MSTLYIIATPIGNLEDITLRALRILKEVDFILCEDTRVTGRLLSKYNITTPRISYHAQSKLSKTDTIFSFLNKGKNLALVSDAGTPCISDPGMLLISQVLTQLPAVHIVPIPGPSALTTALSAGGISIAEFTFLGFLPHKKGRETLFKEIAAAHRPIVFYESPHRIEKTLASLEKFCGTDRMVIVARELTKIYEEFVRGSISGVRDYFDKNQEHIRGEFVVIVESE